MSLILQIRYTAAELAADGEKRREAIARLAPYLILAAVIFLSVLHGGAVSYADKSTKLDMSAITDGFDMILSILTVVITIIGALLIAVGILKLLTAQAGDDDNGKLKAVLFIASGISFMVIVPIIRKSSFYKNLGK